MGPQLFTVQAFQEMIMSVSQRHIGFNVGLFVFFVGLVEDLFIIRTLVRRGGCRGVLRPRICYRKPSQEGGSEDYSCGFPVILMHRSPVEERELKSNRPQSFRCSW